MNSDTPETDAAVHAAGGDWSPVLRAVAQRLERERDKALSVAGAMADIAFKHLTSLLVSTQHSKNAAHEEETHEVIASIKRWKELKR